MSIKTQLFELIDHIPVRDIAAVGSGQETYAVLRLSLKRKLISKTRANIMIDQVNLESGSSLPYFN